MARKPDDLVGKTFGRLTVIGDSGERSRKGQVFWTCLCECGNMHKAVGPNLKGGNVSSCGCLARELSSIRGKARAVPKPVCTVEGCTEEAREYDRTLCATHAMRMRRHDDPTYITPPEVTSAKLRELALQRTPDAKPDTYRKLFGRHEHRVIGEQIAGRPLRSDEHVHHIDEDKHNNDPSNLEVLSAAEHLRLHAKKRSAANSNAKKAA